MSDTQKLRDAASSLSWSQIDGELSAYVALVRTQLIEACAKEAERCDTHALFCMADPAAIRRDIASRIRALVGTAHE